MTVKLFYVSISTALGKAIYREYINRGINRKLPMMLLENINFPFNLLSFLIVEVCIVELQYETIKCIKLKFYAYIDYKFTNTKFPFKVVNELLCSFIAPAIIAAL